MLSFYMESIILRTVYSLIVSFCITVVLTPWVIKKLREKGIGQVVRKEGVPAHLQKSGIPTMGGVTMIVAVSVSVLLWCRPERNVLLVLSALWYMGVLGFADDYLKWRGANTGGVSAKRKFLAQTVFALLVGLFLFQAGWMKNEIFVPLFNLHLDWSWFYVFFVALTIVGSSNAVNLTDGLDGLASGVLFIVTACMGIIAYFAGNAIYSAYLGIPAVTGGGELTVFCFAVVGACLGFLWYNASPAQVFMGDTGSLAMGGALGMVAVLCKAELFLVIVGGIFVVEALSVILQVGSYRLKHRKIFRMAPIHHHFELMGWAENKVVIRFWIMALILALLGMSVLWLNGRL
jgi:phospho-N-acetylmuramoyl-pentapeptide-transferase